MKHKIKINFFKKNSEEYEVEDGENLLEALSDLGLIISSPCGGKGSCGKCLVEVEGDLNEIEPLEKKFIKTKNQRLACKAVVKGDLTVFIKEGKEDEILKIPLEEGVDYGIAVDLGTTSIHISVVDMEKKKSFKLDSFLNPQRRYGADVISRIAAAEDKVKFEKMIFLIRNEIAKAVVKVFDNAKVSIDNIKNIVFSGNTVMSYLIFGEKISSLGTYPYLTDKLEFNERNDWMIEDKLLSIKSLPMVSAFLGGDLLGGVAFLDFKGYDKDTFFIDLGTNGEMFIRDSVGKITATSCAMGPALEGMNISCGMTAENGAINHLKENDKVVEYSVIGEKEPVGLSGTAIVDFLSIMTKNGLVLKSGLMKKNLENLKLVSYNSGTSGYHLTDDIFLSQKDVRNIQLAKGASLAGAEVLLKESNVKRENVKYVVIAGAFGENLDLENFKELKFLPNFENAEYLFMGNTSLKAAEQVLFDEEFYRKSVNFQKNITTVELSNYKGFNDLFMESFEF